MGVHPGFECLGVLLIYRAEGFHLLCGDFSGGTRCLLQGDHLYEYMFWENRHGLVVVFPLTIVRSLRQGVSPRVLLAFNVMNFVVILQKFKYFPSDLSIYVLWGLPVL